MITVELVAVQVTSEYKHDCAQMKLDRTRWSAYPRNASMHRVKWRHSNLWSRYDLHVVRNDVVGYGAKLTGENLSHYLNKIESIGLRIS